MEIASGVDEVELLGARGYVILEDRLTLIDAGLPGSRVRLADTGRGRRGPAGARWAGGHPHARPHPGQHLPLRAARTAAVRRRRARSEAGPGDVREPVLQRPPADGAGQRATSGGLERRNDRVRPLSATAPRCTRCARGLGGASRRRPRRSVAIETLIDLVTEGAARYDDRPALLIRPSFRTRVWRYRDLAAVVPRAARVLADAGLKPGDRVIIWAVNRPEWVIAFLATAHAGGVTV